MLKKSGRVFLKFTALGTLFFFSASSLGWAQIPATVNAADRPESVLIQEPLAIPEEFGTIQEQNLSPDKTKPFIVFIQDAHAMADAQSNIQKILRYLQEKYHLSLVALEGGAGKMDATLFRAFPDSKLEQKVMEEYVARGELSGAQMASVFNPAQMNFFGIEDWKLYEANYLAFLRAGQNREAVLKNLKTLTQELDEKRKSVYTHDLNEFHEYVENFRGGEGDLFVLLNYLNGIGLSEDQKAKYAHLKTLLDSIGREQMLNTESLKIAIQRLAEKFKKETASKMDKVRVMELNEKMQAFSTARIDSAAFLKFLLSTSARESYDLPLDPSMKELLKHADMLAGIKGTKLFDELEKLLAEIQERLAVTPEQKAMARKYAAIRILKDMAALEMTRDELREYEKDPAYYHALLEDAKLLDGAARQGQPGQAAGGGRSRLASALEFYRLALERDRALYSNLEKLMSRKKASSAAVILGGFHRQGFEGRLKQQNYSYAVIAPKMLSLTDPSVYQNVMLGKLSYKDYLKTTFYDAFARHAGMRLISEMNEPDFRNSLKQWRDQIIRNLSEEGRVGEAGQYTHYVDLLLKVYMEKYGTKNLTLKSKEEILKDAEKELNGLKDAALNRMWKGFEAQIKTFTAGLRQLMERKELTRENVEKLMESAGRTNPSALAASLGALSPETPSDLLREFVLNPDAFGAEELETRLEAALSAIGFSKLTREQLEVALQEEAGGAEGLTPEISNAIQQQVGNGVAALDVLEKATKNLPESESLEPVTPEARLAVKSIVSAVHDTMPADAKEKIVKKEIAREILTTYQKINRTESQAPSGIQALGTDISQSAKISTSLHAASLGIEKIGEGADKVQPVTPGVATRTATEAPKDQETPGESSAPGTSQGGSAQGDVLDLSDEGKAVWPAVETILANAPPLITPESKILPPDIEPLIPSWVDAERRAAMLSHYRGLEALFERMEKTGDVTKQRRRDVDAVQFAHGIDDILELIGGMITRQQASPQNPVRILDVGAGVGVFLEELSDRLRDKGWSDIVKLCGVDAMPLPESREKQLAAKDIEFKRGLGEYMPYENERMHLILGTHILEYPFDPYQFLRETFRLLVPGGRASLTLIPNYYATDGTRIAQFIDFVPPPLIQSGTVIVDGKRKRLELVKNRAGEPLAIPYEVRAADDLSPAELATLGFTSGSVRIRTRRLQGQSLGVDIRSLEDLERGFSSGDLLAEGLERLKKEKPDLKITSLSDISKLNEKVTNFDISLLPLLTKIPEAVLSAEDWGIYRLTHEGIEYRTKEGKREFVGFTETGRRFMPEAAEKARQDYFANQISKTARFFLLHPWAPEDVSIAKDLLDRGRALMKTVTDSDRAKTKAFISASEAKNNDGPMEFDTASLLVLLSMLDKIPEMLKAGTPRANWYWLPGQGGLEFVNKVTGQKEFLPYSQGSDWSKSKEALKVRENLGFLEILTSHTALNSLDQLALNNTKGLMTDYDQWRRQIAGEFKNYFPLAYDHFDVYFRGRLTEKSKLSWDQVVSHRFTLRELELTHSALAALPPHLLTDSQDLYFSYRPDQLFNFTHNYEDDSHAAFFFAPLAMRNAGMVRRIVESPELTQFFSGLDDARVNELSYARIHLHEKGHRVYKELNEDLWKSYGQISWDLDSWEQAWKVRSAVRKNADAMASPPNHFMIRYPSPEADNSEEDFVDHFSAYVMFGPAFRAAAERAPALRAKYEFLKEQVFRGVEYQTYFDLPQTSGQDSAHGASLPTPAAPPGTVAGKSLGNGVGNAGDLISLVNRVYAFGKVMREAGERTQEEIKSFLAGMNPDIYSQMELEPLILTAANFLANYPNEVPYQSVIEAIRKRQPQDVLWTSMAIISSSEAGTLKAERVRAFMNNYAESVLGHDIGILDYMGWTEPVRNISVRLTNGGVNLGNPAAAIRAAKSLARWMPESEVTVHVSESSSKLWEQSARMPGNLRISTEADSGQNPVSIFVGSNFAGFFDHDSRLFNTDHPANKNPGSASWSQANVYVPILAFSGDADQVMEIDGKKMFYVPFSLKGGGVIYYDWELADAREAYERLETAALVKKREELMESLKAGIPDETRGELIRNAAKAHWTSAYYQNAGAFLDYIEALRQSVPGDEELVVYAVPGGVNDHGNLNEWTRKALSGMNISYVDPEGTHEAPQSRVKVVFLKSQPASVFEELLLLSGKIETRGLSQKYPNLATGDISFYQNLSARKLVVHDYFSGFFNSKKDLTGGYGELYSQEYPAENGQKETVLKRAEMLYGLKKSKLVDRFMEEIGDHAMTYLNYPSTEGSPSEWDNMLRGRSQTNQEWIGEALKKAGYVEAIREMIEHHREENAFVTGIQPDLQRRDIGRVLAESLSPAAYLKMAPGKSLGVREILAKAPALDNQPGLGKVIDAGTLNLNDDQKRELAREIADADTIAFRWRRETYGSEYHWFHYLERIPEGHTFLFLVNENGELGGYILGTSFPRGKSAVLERIATTKRLDKIAGKGWRLMDQWIAKLRSAGITRVSWEAVGDSPDSFYRPYLLAKGVSFTAVDFESQDEPAKVLFTADLNSKGEADQLRLAQRKKDEDRWKITDQEFSEARKFFMSLPDRAQFPLPPRDQMDKVLEDIRHFLTVEPGLLHWIPQRQVISNLVQSLELVSGQDEAPAVMDIGPGNMYLGYLLQKEKKNKGIKYIGVQPRLNDADGKAIDEAIYIHDLKPLAGAPLEVYANDSRSIFLIVGTIGEVLGRYAEIEDILHKNGVTTVRALLNSWMPPGVNLTPTINDLAQRLKIPIFSFKAEAWYDNLTGTSASYQNPSGFESLGDIPAGRGLAPLQRFFQYNATPPPERLLNNFRESNPYWEMNNVLQIQIPIEMRATGEAIRAVWMQESGLEPYGVEKWVSPAPGTADSKATRGEGKSLGTAEDKQAALETIDTVIQALRKNYALHQSVPDYRNEIMKKGLAKDVEYILVGDLHGRPENLWGILAANDNYGKIMRGEAVLVLLGDAVHPDRGDAAALSDMTSSVVIHRMIMELMRRAIDKDGYLRRVVYIPGNHEHLEPEITKSVTHKGYTSLVHQGLLFAEQMAKDLGPEYLNRYVDGFMANSPLLFITDGLLADHAGPISAGLKLAHIRQARVTDAYGKWDMSHLIAQEAQWRRWSDDPDASFASYYGADQVNYFLEMPGIEQPDAVLLVGHSPSRIPHGKFYHKLTEHHYVIYAARSEFGYASFKNGKLNFKKAVTIPDVPPDWNLDRLVKTPQDKAVYHWAKEYFKRNGWEENENDYYPEFVTQQEILPKALDTLSKFSSIRKLKKARDRALKKTQAKLEKGETVELYEAEKFDLAIKLLKFRQQNEIKGQSLGQEMGPSRQKVADLEHEALELKDGGYLSAAMGLYIEARNFATERRLDAELITDLQKSIDEIDGYFTPLKSPPAAGSSIETLLPYLYYFNHFTEQEKQNGYANYSVQASIPGEGFHLVLVRQKGADELVMLVFSGPQKAGYQLAAGASFSLKEENGRLVALEPTWTVSFIKEQGFLRKALPALLHGKVLGDRLLDEWRSSEGQKVRSDEADDMYKWLKANADKLDLSVRFDNKKQMYIVNRKQQARTGLWRWLPWGRGSSLGDEDAPILQLEKRSQEAVPFAVPERSLPAGEIRAASLGRKDKTGPSREKLWQDFHTAFDPVERDAFAGQRGDGAAEAVEALIPINLLRRLTAEVAKSEGSLTKDAQPNPKRGGEYNPWTNTISMGRSPLEFTDAVGEWIFARMLVRDSDRINVPNFWTGYFGSRSNRSDKRYDLTADDIPKLLQRYLELIGAKKASVVNEWRYYRVEENFAQNISRLIYGAPFLVGKESQATTEDILKFFQDVGIIDAQEADQYKRLSSQINGGTAVQPIKVWDVRPFDKESVGRATGEKKVMQREAEIRRPLKLEEEIAFRLGINAKEAAVLLKNDPVTLLSSLRSAGILNPTLERKIFDAVQSKQTRKKAAESRPGGFAAVIARSSNSLQRSRLDQIERLYGIVDPSLEIAQIAEKLAKQVLRNSGLPAEEYVFVVADSDEMNAMFYTREGEKVIQFNRGLLEFLRDNKDEEGRTLLDAATISFILGHETGHALSKKKNEDDPKYRHMQLAEEYAADEYGSSAANLAGHTPLGGLRFIRALRRADKSFRITYTHPQTHRREYKIFNDIRHQYWNNLNEKIESIPSSAVDVPRSSRFAFDEGLYKSFTFENIRQAIDKATSPHDLIKLIHLFNVLLGYQAVFEEYETPTVTGFKAPRDTGETYQKDYYGSDFTEYTLKYYSTGLAEKFLRDNGVNPEVYFTPEQRETLRLQAVKHKMELRDVLFLALAREIQLNVGQTYDVPGPNQKAFNPYAMEQPVVSREKAKGPYNPEAFWRKKSELYRRFSPLLSELRLKVRQLQADLADLTDHDSEQLVSHFYLAGLHYLDPVNLAPHKNPFLEWLSWDNPVASLKTVFRHYRNYENDYVDNLPKENRWARELRSEEEDRTSHFGLDRYTVWYEYMDRFIQYLLDQIKDKDDVSLDELVSLYEVYSAYRQVLPYRRPGSGTSADYGAMILDLSLKKVRNFEEFRAYYERVEPLILGDVDAGEIFRDWFAQVKDLSEISTMLEFLFSKSNLRRAAIRAVGGSGSRTVDGVIQMEGVFMDSVKALLASFPTQQKNEWVLGLLGRLDGILDKYGVIAAEKDRRDDSLYWFSGAYAFLISLYDDTSDDNKEFKDNLYIKYYRKFGLNWPYESVDGRQPYEIKQLSYHNLFLEQLAIRTIAWKGNSLTALEDFIDRGLLPDKRMLESVADREIRQRIFTLLPDRRQVFLDNGTNEKDYNRLVSILGWEWFMNRDIRYLMFRGTGRDLLKELEWASYHLPLSDHNSSGLSSVMYLLGKAGTPADLSDQEFEVLARLANSVGIEKGRPSFKLDLFIKYEEFMDPLRTRKDSSGNDINDRKTYESERVGYVPFWDRLKENESDEIALQWGKRFFQLWLERHPDAALSVKVEWAKKFFPEPSAYRDRVLIDLVGDPYSHPAADFKVVFESLTSSVIKEVLGKRILLAEKEAGTLKLDTYANVKSEIANYFSEDSLMGQEMLNKFLQDAEVTIPELRGHKGESVLEKLARDRKKAIIHEVVERLLDDLESRPAERKREIFEWLIGAKSDKPGLVEYYEYTLKADLSDLPRLLALVSDAERYSFLTTLFIGPKGILGDTGEREKLLKVIFKQGMGEEPSDSNQYFLILDEVFRASPEAKQLDLVHGIFSRFLERKPAEAGAKDQMVSRFLASFGLVGVKMGQIFGMEDLTDEVPPLDKRYLLSALLFDHKPEDLDLIASVGKLLGSGSIGQNYVVTLKDGSKVALKYIRPLAHAEVIENLKIMRIVVNNLRGKIPGLAEKVSDTLLDEIERAVRRELEIEREVENQITIGKFLNGMKRDGWEQVVPRVHPRLRGAQFFASEYIEGAESPKKAFIDRVGPQTFAPIAALNFKSFLRQALILGRYHADWNRGNILIGLDRQKSFLFDFGNTARLSKKNQETFIYLLLALDEGDADSALGILTARFAGNVMLAPDVRERLRSILMEQEIPPADRIKRAKAEFEKVKIDFNPEFEVLFKVFETMGYLTSPIKGEMRGIFEEVVRERQFYSLENFFSGLTFKLALSRISASSKTQGASLGSDWSRAFRPVSALINPVGLFVASNVLAISLFIYTHAADIIFVRNARMGTEEEVLANQVRNAYQSRAFLILLAVNGSIFLLLKFMRHVLPVLFRKISPVLRYKDPANPAVTETEKEVDTLINRLVQKWYREKRWGEGTRNLLEQLTYLQTEILGSDWNSKKWSIDKATRNRLLEQLRERVWEVLDQVFDKESGSMIARLKALAPGFYIDHFAEGESETAQAWNSAYSAYIKNPQNRPRTGYSEGESAGGIPWSEIRENANHVRPYPNAFFIYQLIDPSNLDFVKYIVRDGGTQPTIYRILKSVFGAKYMGSGVREARVHGFFHTIDPVIRKWSGGQILLEQDGRRIRLYSRGIFLTRWARALHDFFDQKFDIDIIGVPEQETTDSPDYLESGVGLKLAFLMPAEVNAQSLGLDQENFNRIYQRQILTPLLEKGGPGQMRVLYHEDKDENGKEFGEVQIIPVQNGREGVPFRILYPKEQARKYAFAFFYHLRLKFFGMDPVTVGYPAEGYILIRRLSEILPRFQGDLNRRLHPQMRRAMEEALKSTRTTHFKINGRAFPAFPLSSRLSDTLDTSEMFEITRNRVSQEAYDQAFPEFSAWIDLETHFERNQWMTRLLYAGVIAARGGTDAANQRLADKLRRKGAFILDDEFVLMNEHRLVLFLEEYLKSAVRAFEEGGIFNREGAENLEEKETELLDNSKGLIRFALGQQGLLAEELAAAVPHLVKFIFRSSYVLTRDSKSYQLLEYLTTLKGEDGRDRYEAWRERMSTMHFDRMVESVVKRKAEGQSLGDATVRTSKGKRKYQEDSVLDMEIKVPGVPHGKGRLMIVADGHGEDGSGAQASLYAARNFPNYLRLAMMETGEYDFNQIEEAMKLAAKLMSEDMNVFEAGTTFSAVYIPDEGSRAYLAFIGDSPIRIFKPGQGDPIGSVSHNVSALTPAERDALLKQKGLVYEQDAYLKDPKTGTSNQLFRAFGDRNTSFMEHDAEVTSVFLEPGDVIVLGSDGLWLDHQIQRNAVRQGADADTLVHNALSQIQTTDNVTAMVYKFEGPKEAATGVPAVTAVLPPSALPPGTADREAAPEAGGASLPPSSQAPGTATGGSLPRAEIDRLNAMIQSGMDFEQLSHAVHVFHEAGIPFPLARFSQMNENKTMEHYAAEKLIQTVDEMGGLEPEKVARANEELVKVWDLYRNLGTAPGMYREPGKPDSKPRTLGTQVLFASKGQWPGKAKFEKDLKKIIDEFGQDEITYYNHEEDARRVESGLLDAVLKGIQASINRQTFYMGVAKFKAFAIYDEATDVVRNVTFEGLDDAALKGDKSIPFDMLYNTHTGEYFLSSAKDIFSLRFPVYGEIGKKEVGDAYQPVQFLADRGFETWAVGKSAAESLKAIGDAVASVGGNDSNTAIPVVSAITNAGEQTITNLPAQDVRKAITELRIIGIDGQGSGHWQDFHFVKVDELPNPISGASLGQISPNLFQNNKIKEDVLAAMAQQKFDEKSVQDMEQMLTHETRLIFDQAREDLNRRGNGFLAMLRLEEADEIIRDLISGKFRDELLQALGPWHKNNLIPAEEVDGMISRIQGFVFGEAMRTANAALSILQKYYEDGRIELYQGKVERAVEKITAEPGGGKLPLATNFNRERMQTVRAAVAPFAGRIKELKIYYDAKNVKNVPGRQDIAAWSGLNLNVIFKRMDGAKLLAADLDSFYVLTQHLDLPPDISANLHSIMAEILELKDERVQKLAFSSAILLAFLIADYLADASAEERARKKAELLKPEFFRHFLETQKDKLGDDVGFLGQWFEMGAGGVISLRLSQFVFSLVNQEAASQALQKAA